MKDEFKLWAMGLGLLASVLVLPISRVIFNHVAVGTSRVVLQITCQPSPSSPPSNFKALH